MRRAAAVMALLSIATWASAAEKAKLDPRYLREVTRVRNKLGSGFTVTQVGTFVVASDLPEARRAQYEALIATQERLLYAKLFTTHPRYILKIVLFKDNASLRRNAKKMAEKSAVTTGGGFFLPYEKVICAETTMGSWVVKHELTHALLHADFRRTKLRPWIDEGVAMLVESATLGKDDITFRLDWRLSMVQRARAAGKLPKLASVLKMDFRTYNHPRNRMLCDAVARNLLMYLHERKQFVPFYKHFRSNYRRDTTGIRSLEATLGRKLDAIEVDWHAWLKAGQGVRPTRATQP